MSSFQYAEGRLQCGKVDVSEIARSVGTPCYVYSADGIRRRFRDVRDAFAPRSPRGLRVCYSVKANSSLAVIDLLRREGAGFDVVSGGELFRVLKTGAEPERVVYAGVGKTEEELRFALQSGVGCIHVESEPELEVLDGLAARMGVRARAALRVNPDVDPRTHRHIVTGKKETKFGVDLERAERILLEARRRTGVDLRSIHCHIGSQIESTEPYVRALDRLVPFVESLEGKGVRIEEVNLGGGFGIWYREKRAPRMEEFAGAMAPALARLNRPILVEPGRFLVGEEGILVTRVTYVKPSWGKVFLICDAGMNDLIRPVLYDAYHRIWPVVSHPSLDGEAPEEDGFEAEEMILTDVVGPVCETGDYFARDRRLPASVRQGDLLAIFCAGAYGYTMASNYNSLPKPAEALVEAGTFRVVTRRETYEDMIRLESI